MNIPQDTPEQPASPTPPPEAPAPQPHSADPGQPHAAAGSARFFQWCRRLGVQRGPNRWMGGVCSGLAAKWNIDPVIVRGLAVVLTLFFGIGLLAYGVAWALLPEPDGRIHVEEVARGRWSAGMTGAAVLTVLGLAGPGRGVAYDGSGGWFPWPLFWIAGVAALIYWAVNSNKTKTAPAIPAGDQPEHGTSFQDSTWQDSSSYAASRPFVPNPQLYVKYKPVKTTPRLGAAASMVALGMAAIVGAVILILDSARIIDLNGYQAGIAVAAAAITLGIAIVAAGIAGRRAGGLGTFAIIALVVAALLSLPAQTGPLTSFNNTTWTPDTLSDAQTGRTVVLGNATFDLSKLDDASPLGSEVQVPLKTVVSRVTLKVPAEVPVTINSELAAVSLSIDGHDEGGTLTQDMTTELNADATGNGIVISLQGVASNIEIETVK